MAYKVGTVAKLAGVSVRTLHHYDEIGLVSPSERSESGYRLYTDGDLDLLQQVLVYRDLEFGLDRIREVVTAPGFDRLAALAEQREMVAAKLARDRALLDLIETTIIALEGGMDMTPEEKFEVFGDFDPSAYEDEVVERWGDTDAYKISARRTKGYTKDDWARMQAEQSEVNARIVALFEAGVSAQAPEAMDAAEDARLLIDRWFYPLSREMHVGLGEMCVADPRFTATYDKMSPGLAPWLRDAIRSNASRD